MKKLSAIALSAAIMGCAPALAVAQDQPGPTPDPDAMQNPAVKSPNKMTSGPLAAGHNSFTKSEARSRIEQAGYTNVTALKLDENGLWKAQATRDGQHIVVALDYKGDIAPL